MVIFLKSSFLQFSQFKCWHILLDAECLDNPLVPVPKASERLRQDGVFSLMP